MCVICVYVPFCLLVLVSVCALPAVTSPSHVRGALQWRGGSPSGAKSATTGFLPMARTQGLVVWRRRPPSPPSPGSVLCPPFPPFLFSLSLSPFPASGCCCCSRALSPTPAPGPAVAVDPASAPAPSPAAGAGAGSISAARTSAVRSFFVSGPGTAGLARPALSPLGRRRRPPLLGALLPRW